MPTSKVEYLGELRTTAVHLASSEKIITDAPTDNQGKGEAFSPTDLLATSLANCMITIIGISAMQQNLPEPKMEATVTKLMATNPRRVQEIVIDVIISCPEATDAQQAKLEDAGRNCPVAHSLSASLVQTIRFNWV